MSTAVWPPIAPEDLVREEEASLARELEWLLNSLQETFSSLKLGLEECAALLSPDEGASTLVLSSLRSEAVKGFITRTGARITKGDIRIRLPSLPPPRGSLSLKLSISSSAAAPTLYLEQLTKVRTLINASLDIIDVSTWTGDAKNADFISGQLHLLFDNVQEAKQTLKGGMPGQKSWWEDPVDEKVFDPPCPQNMSFHLFISEAALVLHIRTLESASAPVNDSITGYSIRGRLAVALGAPKAPSHDELHEIFMYKGQQVRVKEKLRVESQDPSLLAAMAKLGAVEHGIAMSRRALNTVMGTDDVDWT